MHLQALAICESFGITDTMLSAPIGNYFNLYFFILLLLFIDISTFHPTSISSPALDWVGYNSYDNQGELMTEQEWDQTVRKA